MKQAKVWIYAPSNADVISKSQKLMTVKAQHAK
jgi:hypothetical protein